MVLKIRPARSADELDHVRRLYRGFIDWQTKTYHDVNFLLQDFYQAVEADIASLPGEYAPPGGSLVLAWVDGKAAGTGALMFFGEQTCELKRMFVSAKFQGHGIGRAMVEFLIQEARSLGYERMVLETGPRQLAAQKLYVGMGFREIEPYYDLEIPDEVIAKLPEDIQRGVIFMEMHL